MKIGNDEYKVIKFENAVVVAFKDSKLANLTPIDIYVMIPPRIYNEELDSLIMAAVEEMVYGSKIKWAAFHSHFIRIWRIDNTPPLGSLWIYQGRLGYFIRRNNGESSELIRSTVDTYNKLRDSIFEEIG